MLGQHFGGAERHEAERQVVELDGVQDRREVLRAEFGGILIAQPAAGLDRAADELQRIGEVGDGGDERQAAVAGVVGVVGVGREGREHVQEVFQRLLLIGLHQRSRGGGEVVDIGGQHVAVLVEEFA